MKLTTFRGADPSKPQLAVPGGAERIPGSLRRSPGAARPRGPSRPSSRSLSTEDGELCGSRPTNSASRRFSGAKWRPRAARCGAASAGPAGSGGGGRAFPARCEAGTQRSLRGSGLPQGLPARSGARRSRRREMEGAGPPHGHCLPCEGLTNPPLGNPAAGKDGPKFPIKTARGGCGDTPLVLDFRACPSVGITLQNTHFDPGYKFKKAADS